MNNKQEPSLSQVAAAVVGNALEWYDWIIFGFMTGIISRVFFPPGNPYGSLMATIATFAVGVVVRPIGGILVGVYADRKGRKAALQLIIAAMTMSTALIAFAPSYASIGLGSSVIVVLARLLQGLATGGGVCKFHRTSY